MKKLLSFTQNGIQFLFFKKRVSDEAEEDKYGNIAMLKKLNDEYRCPKCKEFLVYGDDSCQTLVCLACGFQKSAPAKEVKK
ncbi:MAG: hypothetical protein WC420_00190 [Candidatus Paceibacterota bacterium]|jgi:predicted RNA-binding Zn-ribbon protein involved in translation (DUF1610 family)